MVWIIVLVAEKFWKLRHSHAWAVSEARHRHRSVFKPANIGTSSSCCAQIANHWVKDSPHAKIFFNFYFNKNERLGYFGTLKFSIKDKLSDSKLDQLGENTKVCSQFMKSIFTVNIWVSIPYFLCLFNSIGYPWFLAISPAAETSTGI